MIIAGSHKVTGRGIFCSDLQQKSLAFSAGLKVGDMILAVNTESFLSISHDEATAVLKQLTGKVRMLVVSPKEEQECRETGCKPGTGKASENTGMQEIIEEAKPAAGISQTKPGAAGPAGKAEDRRTSLAPAGAATAGKPSPGKTTPAKSPAKVEELKVEVKLSKDQSFGLIVVGGTNSPLGGVFIDEIVKGSAADKVGKLEKGFKILTVNGKDVTKVTEEEAVRLIRGAKDKVTCT